ncbi:MAG: DNA recombination protein RmuC [Holosporales bacterium]|nr:DNA recombination protein RmuC [Holosporales bacterium]
MVILWRSSALKHKSPISDEIFIRSHNNFLNIAKNTFDKVLNMERVEHNRRENDFSNLIKPIQETLTSFNEKISLIEKERVSAYSDLKRQVNDLMLYQQEIQKETASLNKALSNPFMTGQWGEMQLRRVVEIAGMMVYCDFIEQQQGEQNRFRPDMIIKLPGNRNIIVDAKAPIDAYMQAINTGEEGYMENHAKRIKLHIRTLGQKAYWEQFSPTPEFVLMFLPGESFFSSAIKQDPSLVEFGIKEKVIITTPITLIALLKTISFSWRQEAIAANAKKIGEVGRAVFYNLEKLVEQFKIFGRRIQKNVEEYEKIDSFLERAVIPSTKKLKTLGIEISDKKTQPELEDS